MWPPRLCPVVPDGVTAAGTVGCVVEGVDVAVRAKALGPVLASLGLIVERLDLFVVVDVEVEEFPESVLPVAEFRVFPMLVLVPSSVAGAARSGGTRCLCSDWGAELCAAHEVASSEAVRSEPTSPHLGGGLIVPQLLHRHPTITISSPTISRWQRLRGQVHSRCR